MEVRNKSRDTSIYSASRSPGEQCTRLTAKRARSPLALPAGSSSANGQFEDRRFSASTSHGWPTPDDTALFGPPDRDFSSDSTLPPYPDSLIGRRLVDTVIRQQPSRSGIDEASRYKRGAMRHAAWSIG